MKHVKLIVFLIFGCFYLNAQTGIITYNIKGVKDSETSEFVKEVNAELDLMEFGLNYNSTGSYFYKEQHVPLNVLKSKIATVAAGSPYDFYQYFKTKKSLQNRDVVNKTYQLDFSKRMNGWELKKDTKKIDNYTCYKAVHTEFIERTQTYREVIAWYTTDIPVPYGPAGYGGLPGLILELHYGNNALYVAQKITLNKPIELPKITKGEIITPREWAILNKKNRKVTPD